MYINRQFFSLTKIKFTNPFIILPLPFAVNNIMIYDVSILRTELKNYVSSLHNKQLNQLLYSLKFDHKQC